MKYYLCRVEGRIVLETTQAQAKELDASFKPLEIPTDKDGLKKFAEVLFNRNPSAVAAATDAEEALPAPETPKVEVEPAPPKPAPYAEVSIKIEEAFENLPLAQQLHFAAIAMENARSAIKPRKVDKE